MYISIIQEAFYPNRINENLKRIKAYFRKATTDKVELVIVPAYALCGFNPLDALKNEDYLKDCRKATDKLILATRTSETALVFDLPFVENNKLYQRLLFVHRGKILSCHDKSILCSHSFMDEPAYFSVGCNTLSKFTHKSRQIVLCFADEVLNNRLQSLSPDFCICTDAYPYAYDIWRKRQTSMMNAATEAKCGMIYVNQSGGHDRFVLQGASFVQIFKGSFLSKQGKNAKNIFQLPLLESMVTNINMQTIGEDVQNIVEENESDIALIHRALVIGIRDYFKRCGAKTAILGLSGGIDSALVLPLAVEALGRKNVFGLMMPSQFSTEHSVNDAVQSAENLQIYYEIIPIKPIYDAYIEQLKAAFKGTSFGLAEENIQARVRGGLLMGMSNKFGHLLLNTSNKSESACGYGTLYGDLCGGLAVIGDLYKNQVYELAHYINRKKEIIPKNSIFKAPSAELRPNQKDADSLPDYDILDGILRLHIEEGLNKAQLIKKGYTKIAVERTLGLLYANEYKRKQVPPAIRISSTALGIDRLMPMIF